MNKFRATVAAAALLASTSTIAFAAEPVLEPVTQKFVSDLAASGFKGFHVLTPDEARKVLVGAQSGAVKKPAASIEDRVIPVGPTGETRIRILRPEGAQGTLPVVMYYHGAGWVMGDAATHDRLVRELAVGANAAVVFVDYDRSPENRYPVAIEQDYAALKYVFDNAVALNVDASRIAIAGDSVGGNMTAVVSLLAKERKGPSLKGQLLFYPVTDAKMDNGSYSQFENGPLLTKAAMRWFWDAYLPDEGARKDRTVSPLNASLEQLKGLPPALVITAENDVLRDEGEDYAKKLIQAGVTVTSTRYNGTVHDFVMLNALSETPAARGAIAQATSFLKDVLR
ncbi:alpha/beta hydrolase fold domain-containing protein [Lacibacterium aquatile]|uniref:Alpha/beta hydrolase fold domain-containing protein n=1 Tax=Lacibacterium aquatile TaxID=1168082 RepID=A0ABW5DYY5_9PROT